MIVKFLRFAGPAIFLVGVLIWLIGGARAGFSNNSIEIVKVDEITGLEFTDYKDGFEPGIEFIAAGFFGFSVLLASAAFLENRKQSLTTNT